MTAPCGSGSVRRYKALQTRLRKGTTSRVVRSIDRKIYLAAGDSIIFVSDYPDVRVMNYAALFHFVRLWRDRRGQDLIEYALMAGFVAVAAGAIMPNVAVSISTIFSLVGSVMSNAANQGS